MATRGPRSHTPNTTVPRRHMSLSVITGVVLNRSRGGQSIKWGEVGDGPGPPP